MKHICGIFAAAVFLFSAPAFAQECDTIQGGNILDTTGAQVTPGYDQWGYNYEAHMFNGGYCDSYRGATWCLPYADVELIMKWNDAWISNKDCDGDRKLDRHFAFAGYKGSGAWLTNHQSGLVDVNGKMKRWTYFSKIVAVPADAVCSAVPCADGSIYRTAEGSIIGTAIWGDFAVVEEINNDPSAGAHGRLHADPVNPGLGNL